MFLKDKPQPASEDREPPMPELLEDYKAGRMRLIVQARELERLRQQVRASAEREAAAIVTTARRNVRQVLLDARRELLVLVAQLQAVGCDTPPEGAANYVVQSSATASSIVGDGTSGSSDPAAAGAVSAGEAAANEIVSGARRDVREVLIEAQNELLALAEEARDLRARIARQHGGSLAPAPEVPADVAAPIAFVPEEEPAEQPDAPLEEPAEYTPLSSGPRVWIAVAAAIVFGAVGIALYLSSGARVAAPAAPRIIGAPQGQAAAPRQPSAQPGSAAAVPAAAAAPDASPLTVAVDVRRPVWIRATVDGRADVGRVFNAGESRKIGAREEVLMRAGDAGAVFVSVNGSEPRALGGDGQVVTRRFGAPRPAAARPALVQAAASPQPTPAPADSTSADVGTTGTRETPAPPRDTGAEREVLRAAQQWFEAYFAGDTAGMKHIETAEFAVVDGRGTGQRLAATMRGVERGLQEVRIEVAGDGAVMSARLTERANVEGQQREYVSLVSGVWIRTDGRWRLTGLRFMDPAALGGRN